jgi:hypothetical protein
MFGSANPTTSGANSPQREHGHDSRIEKEKSPTRRTRLFVVDIYNATYRQARMNQDLKQEGGPLSKVRVAGLPARGVIAAEPLLSYRVKHRSYCHDADSPWYAYNPTISIEALLCVCVSFGRRIVSGGNYIASTYWNPPFGNYMALHDLGSQHRHDDIQSR